jgi:hypothetical protein
VPRKSLKKRIEDNLIVYLIGLLILWGGAIAVPIKYFANQKLEITKREYETKLASINRRLAGGDYFDVSKILITADERNKVPPTSKFYDDDSFYAIDLPAWTYKKMSDVEFYNTVYGEEGNKPSSDITKLAPFHVWTRGKWIPVDKHDLVHNLAPVIIVQCLPVKELNEQLNLREPFTGNLEKPIKDPESGMIFPGDIVGAMLTDTFYSLFQTLHFGSNTHVNLLTINKVKNVLYCQILLTLRDVIVGSQPFNRFYVNFEIIVISTPDTVYTVCAFQPSDSPTPRGSVAAEVTEWLNGFAILSK